MSSLGYLIKEWNEIYRRDYKRWGDLQSMLADIAMKYFKENENMKILDIAGGYGRDSLYFESFGFSSVCIDGCIIAVDEMKKRVNKKGLKNKLLCEVMDVSDVMKYRDLLNDSDILYMNYFLHLLNYEEIYQMIKKLQKNINNEKYIVFNLISEYDMRYAGLNMGSNEEGVRWSFFKKSDVYNIFKLVDLEFLYWEEQREIEWINNQKDEVFAHFIIGKLKQCN